MSGVPRIIVQRPGRRAGSVPVPWKGKENDYGLPTLNDTERRELINALRGNAESDRAILMDRRDTSFAGTADEVTDEEVISAIKSVPCHY